MAMVKIRLLRAGAKKRPFYRIVAIDERRQRDGRALEFLGTYDPMARGPQLQLDTEKVDAWSARGAQLSARVASLVRRARREPPAAAGAQGGAS
jgi:small subunit ribosomal protein S16